MVSESFFDQQSRVNKYNKRRKNTKLLNFLIVMAVLLGLFLAFMVFFNDNDKQVTGDIDSNNEEQKEDSNLDENNEDSPVGQEKENNDQQTPSDSGEPVEEDADDPLEDPNVEESTNDPNVLETIVKDWVPIGTVQQEPHVTQIDDSTVDWDEMLRAAHLATQLSEDNSIVWWVTNGGTPDTVEITLTDKAQTQNFRVYLQWITNEGWQTTKVEILKENDKKELFDNDDEENSESEQQQESGD